MRIPRALPFFVLLGAGSAVALGALPSCNNGGGSSPGCIENIDDAGLMYPVDGGCYEFAACPMGAPENCCMDGGAPLTGNALAECLYGFGGCAQLVIKSDGNGNVIETCSSVVVSGSGGSATSSGTGGHSGAGGGG